MVKIDVEKIMQEIRDEIKEKGFKSEQLDFDAISKNGFYDESGFKEAKENINRFWNLEIYSPVAGKGLKRFIKRLIRKIIRPVFIQQLDIQQKFNSNTTHAINELYALIMEQQAYIENLEKKLKDQK